MRLRVVLLLVAWLALAGCSRGSGTVISNGVIPGHMTVTTSCVDGCKRTIMIPMWVPDQAFLIVQGTDKGTSQESLNWKEYALCLKERGMQYPQCLEG